MRWFSLRKKLLSGAKLHGTMVRLARDPGTMAIYAAAGYDFVLVDMEHGSFGMETVADLIRGGKSAGIGTVVRVPRLETFFISRVLDAGAEGIMVPMTSTPAEAESIVRYARYAPVGNRGFSTGTGMTDFVPMKPLEAMKEANENTLVIAQIETREAVENIDAILGVNGIDAALVGPNDLALSLGALEPAHSGRLTAAIDQVVAAATRRGKISGIHGGEPDFVKQWGGKGMGLLACGTDATFQYAAAKQALDAMTR
jgi:2-keto-3-deoxy-L-rhamnonate aldolase RhmA